MPCLSFLICKILASQNSYEVALMDLMKTYPKSLSPAPAAVPPGEGGQYFSPDCLLKSGWEVGTTARGNLPSSPRSQPHLPQDFYLPLLRESQEAWFSMACPHLEEEESSLFLGTVHGRCSQPFCLAPSLVHSHPYPESGAQVTVVKSPHHY